MQFESVLPINQIQTDVDIYPRRNTSQVTVDSYVEALKAGAQFPPIKVQTLEENGAIKIVNLDGHHRLQAYYKYNKETEDHPIKEVQVEHWQEKILDKTKWLEELRIIALQYNLKHGLRVTESDIQYQAEKIIEARPIEALNGIQRELAEKFGLSENRISELIGARVRERRANRNGLIYKLNIEGWIQQNIADALGIGRSTVSEIVGNFETEEIDNLYNRGSKPDKIAEIYQLDMPTLWAILLKDEPDEERFKIFGDSEYSNDQPKIYDVWNFMKKDPRFTTDYPGFCFGQVLMNVLYRWSKQGNLVVDPMAGGGSTLDACLIMGRKCLGYDVKPIRYDIKQNDIREGYPDEAKNCDLIFLDPPYYKKKGEDYNCLEIYDTRPNHINFIEKLAQDSYQTLKKGGYLAFLYSNYYDYENAEDSILSAELYGYFKKAGFKGIAGIQTPLNGSTQHQAHDVDYARKNNIFLAISRDLYIFKKVNQ